MHILYCICINLGNLFNIFLRVPDDFSFSFLTFFFSFPSMHEPDAVAIGTFSFSFSLSVTKVKVHTVERRRLFRDSKVQSMFILIISV